MPEVTSINKNRVAGYSMMKFNHAEDPVGTLEILSNIKAIAERIGELIGSNAVLKGDKKRLPMIKFTVYQGGGRKTVDIKELHVIECEHDKGEMTSEEVHRILKMIGIKAIIHDTSSSTPKYPKWRIFFPLSKPILVDSYSSFEDVKKKRSSLLARANGVLGDILEPESDAINQPWFVGRYIDGMVPDMYLLDKGDFLDEMYTLDAKAIPIKNKRGGISTGIIHEENLTLDTKITDSQGEERTLKDWAKDLIENEKIRVKGNVYRPDSSGTDSAILELTKQQRPCYHDVATGVTHHLTPTDHMAWDIIVGFDDSEFLNRIRRSRVKGERSGEFTAIRITLPQMHRHLVHIIKHNMIALKPEPLMINNIKSTEAMFNGNGTTSTTRRGVTKFTSHFSMWKKSTNRFQVDNITFSAGASSFTESPDGELCLNLWKPIERELMELEYATNKSKPFFDHIRWLFNDRADDFIDWLAHIEQRPDELPHTAWLHIAPTEGLGRSTFGNMLADVWKPYVATDVNLNEALTGNFNFALSGKILAVVSEVKEGGRGPWDHRDNFKSLLNEKERTINRKFMDEYKEYNTMRWLMFSNHEDAIPLDDADRRVEVVINRSTPKSSRYYRDLIANYNDIMFYDAIGKVLQERDIRGFNPGGKAKFTQDKAILLNAAKMPRDYAVDMVKEHWPYDIITSKVLMGIISGETSSELTPRIEAKHNSKYMQKFQKCGKFKDKNRRTVTLYCVKEDKYNLYPKDDNMKAKEAFYDWTNKALEFDIKLKQEGKKLKVSILELVREMKHWKYEPGFPIERETGVSFRKYYEEESI